MTRGRRIYPNGGPDASIEAPTQRCGDKTRGAARCLESAMFRNVVQAIGRTPLIQVNRIIDAPATVLAKCEFSNPLSSVKDRIGAAMIEAAERDGRLAPQTRIVEPTSGNTGI